MKPYSDSMDFAMVLTYFVSVIVASAGLYWSAIPQPLGTYLARGAVVLIVATGLYFGFGIYLSLRRWKRKEVS